ncbi:MAG: helix-turn-helix transcriptional regulator [Deltaproteobacteria bacterium]|nr:helix-turn-helix transcriptional regulator [Deltaproteobacteria bacterium]
MMTEQERRDLLAAFGKIGDRAGWAESTLADMQVLSLMGHLLAAMDERGISQADLGRAMGVHRRQILRWVSSEPSLKAETLIAMGRHVGLRLEARWVPLDDAAAASDAAAAPMGELALAA